MSCDLLKRVGMVNYKLVSPPPLSINQKLIVHKGELFGLNNATSYENVIGAL
jgi:hypothetical protein